MITQTAFVTLSISAMVMVVALGTLFTTLLSGRIGDVADRLTRLETKVDTVQSDLTSRIDTVQTDLTAKVERVQADLGLKVDTVQGAVLDIGGRLTRLEAELGGR